MHIDDIRDRLARPRTSFPRWPRLLDPIVLGPDAIDAGPDAPVPPWLRGASRPAARDAAALVLLYPGPGGEATVVLTVRPSGDHIHAGQVALPGGKREAGDAFPEGTALREATEEIGLDAVAAGVRTLGTLGVVDVRVSGFLMTPVLATAAVEPELRADVREVAEVLRVPVSAFLPGAPIDVVEEVRDGWRLRYGAYPVGGHHVWGATARVLGQLGAVLSGEEG